MQHFISPVKSYPDRGINSYITKGFFYLLIGCSKSKFGQTHQMLLTVRFKFRPKVHQEPCNKVGSLSPAMHLAGFETRTFRFYHNALNHSPLSPYQHSFKWLYAQITNNTCGLLWVQWAL